MPTYEYYCECGTEIEQIQRIGDEAPQCPTCGVVMIRQISHPAVIKVLSKGGNPIRSKGYKEDYSKEYLKDVSPETQ